MLVTLYMVQDQVFWDMLFLLSLVYAQVRIEKHPIHLCTVGDIILKMLFFLYIVF